MIPAVHALDLSILTWLYAGRSLDATYFFIGISESATLLVISGLSLCLWLYLVSKRKYHQAIGLVVATGLAGLSVLFLKEVFHFARPDVFYRAYPETGFSFPSGHAAGSVALYGYVAYLSLKSMSWRYSRFIVYFFSILIALICFSRLYLGVHYFSDVLAGIAVGGLCLSAGVFAARSIKKR